MDMAQSGYQQNTEPGLGRRDQHHSGRGVGGGGTVGPPAVQRPARPRRTWVCGNMLCAESASAVLLFDARESAAWLIDAGEAEWAGLGMCPKHANRFRPPVGWSLSDLRCEAVRSTAEAALETDVGADDSSPADDVEPASAPVQTPLLSRAFRTTEHISN